MGVTVRNHRFCSVKLGLFLSISLGIAGLAPGVRAQTTPDLEEGTRPYGTYDGGQFDSVNLASGKLNIKIPLISYPQRGGKLKLSYDLYFQNLSATIIQVCEPGFPCSYFPEATGGTFNVLANDALTAASVPILETQYNQQYWGKPDHYALAFPDGSTHVTGATTGAGTIWESLDATGLQYNESSNTVIDADGVQYIGVGYTTGSLPQMPEITEDPNGNEITVSGNTITDTFGRSLTQYPALTALLKPVPGGTCPAVPNQPAAAEYYVWQVPGYDGASESFTFCYNSFKYAFTVGGYTFNNAGLNLQSVVLPNGTSWQFTYDSTYNNLQSIILPTGGTISYTWNGFARLCSATGWPEIYNQSIATRTVNDGTNNHTWTYTGLGPYPSTVTAMDPLGDKTVHTMTALNGSDMYYETLTQYYQGSSTLLKSVATSYNYEADPTYHSGACTTVANVIPATITSTWGNGKKAQVAKSYDSPGYSVYVGYPLTEVSGETFVYGRVLSETESDYGSGSPGPILRTTSTTYETSENASYLTNNLLKLPYLVLITGGGVTQQTYYGYDAGTPQTTGAPQLNANPPDGLYPGNPTSIKKCVNASCGQYATTTKTYYNTGLVDASTDPNTGKTQYIYSSNFADALPTTVTDPMGFSTTYNYDFNTALMVPTIDPNQQTTSYQYDEMWRVSQVNYPDEGLATITHQESSFPFTATLTDKMTGSESKVTTNVFDGLGRVTEEQTDDPAGTDLVDTTYDGLGRVASVSNPYRSHSDPTYGVTS